MECRFVAIPEAEVQWFHNKKELVETQRIKVENQADMHMYCSIVRISNVSKKDEGTFFNIYKQVKSGKQSINLFFQIGTYEVCAKNREGEATNTLILNVTAKAKASKPVNEPPMIVKQLTPPVCR